MDAKNLFLWIGPFIFLIVGVVMLLTQIKKRRQDATDTPLSAEDAARVDDLLKK